MRLAFCLFNYFPFGGLQRDFLRIARECVSRGHEVHVYTMRWEGEKEPDLELHLLPVSGMQNHTRSQAFAKKMQQVLAENPHDLVIGFNKMPSLDLYYAADVCYQSRIHTQKPFFYKWLPRYHAWVELEKAVFVNPTTEVMLISPLQQKEYATCYGTPANRFHLLPPGIAKDRIAPANADEIRKAWRQQNGIPEDHWLLLMVGSGFKTKGVDRAIKALAALPNAIKERCHLFVIGQDEPKPFLTLAKEKGVLNRIHFLGGRSDVPSHLLAADVLLHPAYHENTGTALLEAMVSGLPVLTTDVCGYAHYIRDENAGMVLSSPFQQPKFNQALQTLLMGSDRPLWKQNGLNFAKQGDIYHLPQKAADLIETIGQQRALLRSR